MNSRPSNEDAACRGAGLSSAGLRRAFLPRPVGTVEAFSFVELLVAVALGALVLAAAVLCFQAIATYRQRPAMYDQVTIGAAVMTNFYGTNTASVRTWFAPNFGRSANAESMRDSFLEDVQHAIAVYCLPRTGRSAVRPTAVSLTGTYAIGTYDARRIDNSEQFRQLLAANVSGASGVFEANAFSSSGAARGRNLSIMVIDRSDDPAQLSVRAVYEVDFVRSTGTPAGTYASVRRYRGTTLTQYYDVFYPDLPDGTTVSASDFFVAASFERSGRTTGDSPLRLAANQPFYFVWWPDPASSLLPVGTDFTNAMAGQTSYFLVVPMFPAL